jgi:hypothetical protein
LLFWQTTNPRQVNPKVILLYSEKADQVAAALQPENRHPLVHTDAGGENTVPTRPSSSFHQHRRCYWEKTRREQGDISVPSTSVMLLGEERKRLVRHPYR